MAMSCNNCRVKLSGKNPIHTDVNGFVFCDLCADLVKTVQTRMWFVQAHLDHAMEEARKRANLHGY